MSEIVVWSKPACVQCNGVKRWLEKRDVPYVGRQLQDDLDKLEEFKEQGYMQAPIVEGPGGILFSGFNTDELERAVEALEG